MPQTINLASNRASLRERAVAKLTGGALTGQRAANMSEALAVLYKLASSPSTADDALALLHELQVLQVELDMQQEELHHSRSELEEELIRKTDVIDQAPAGLMTIDANTVLREINPAGARLLGASPEELLGCPLAGLMSASSADALQSMLARARDGQVPATCELLLPPLAGVIRAAHATAAKDTNQECFLLILMAAA